MNEAFEIVTTEIVAQIQNYIQTLKSSNEYDKLKQQAKKFRLSAQIFDAFGKSVESAVSKNLFVTTDADIERQFKQAESKLKSFGIANAYLKTCKDWDNLDDYKIDVIIFAANNNSLIQLENFAKIRFHELNDNYRHNIAKLSANVKREYEKIVADSDIVTEHNFNLPETINVPHDNDGKNYSDHLFVDKTTGAVFIKLNGWEEEILKQEQQRIDFVCWIRNTQRAAWALCIPYRAEK